MDCGASLRTKSSDLEWYLEYLFVPFEAQVKDAGNTALYTTAPLYCARRVSK